MKVLTSTLLTPINYLLPEKCALCCCLSNLGFCINCQKLLPWNECVCEVCSIHLPEPGVCGRCQTRRPVYQNSSIPFRYQSPVSEQIQALKYSEQLPYAVAMGKMLALRIAKNTAQWSVRGSVQESVQESVQGPSKYPDTIVPMPLHRKRIAWRGFNQATEIARVLSKQLGIPISHALLKRVKNTVPQTGLNGKMRQQNMINAFVGATNARKTPYPHLHVALLDDVVTSGSTVNAATKALLDAGVERVSVWAIAKT